MWRSIITPHNRTLQALREVEALIVRISRGLISSGGEAEAFALLRESLSGSGGTDGLEAFLIARRMVGGQLELVAMTGWRDLTAMMAVMGPDLQKPSWLPRLGELVESSSVEYLESVAESYSALVALDPTAIDLMAPTEPP
jgi:hypothetical protein